MARRKKPRWLVTGVLAAIFLPIFSEMASAKSMDDFLWSSRPILIFAGDRADTRASEQRQLLDAARHEIEDRDIVVVTIWPDAVEGGRVETNADELRSRYRVEPGRFSVLLVGKDGGVKRRSDEVLAPDALFSQIDSMPMRQREMRDDR